jgi:hypothetical protein
MATILKAGNVATGAQITSDATGILEVRTGTGAGTTAITVGTNQAVTMGAVSSSSLTVNSNNISAVNSLGFRNRIINGAMVIDQRNNGASVTPANGAYTLDRFWYNATQTSKATIQQSTVAPTGFTNSLLVTSSSAYSITSSDVFGVVQRIEGFNTADLGFGTASASTVTVSFWVRSSLTGAFGGSMYNSAADRCYPFSYTINSANTWEQKTVTIAGDTTGTWLTNNGIGITVYFCLGTGSFYGGTANAWAGSTKLGVTGQVSLVGTNGATWYVTGVQLEAGSVATPFERRDYGRELIMCQRYLPVFNVGSGANGERYNGFSQNTTSGIFVFQYLVTPRVPPTGIAVSSASHFNIFNGSNAGIGTVTAIVISVAGITNGTIQTTTTAGSPTLAAGNALQLYANNNAAQIQFTGCEL